MQPKPKSQVGGGIGLMESGCPQLSGKRQKSYLRLLGTYTFIIAERSTATLGQGRKYPPLLSTINPTQTPIVTEKSPKK